MNLKLRGLFLLFLITVLLVPQLALADDAVAECGTHTVVRGENLFRISLRYNVPLATMAAYNGIENAHRIYAGQVLRIPCDGAVVAVPVATPAPSGTVPQDVVNWWQYDPATWNQQSLDCSGFRGTSPDAFTTDSVTFYWDPPADSDKIARYQVRIYNARGYEVGTYETLSPLTHLTGGVGVDAIGPGINFSYRVFAVTADQRLCTTPSVPLQREWTNTSDPA